MAGQNTDHSREAEIMLELFEREQDREEKVRHEVDRLRIHREAEQRLDAGSYPQLPDRTLKDDLAQPPPPRVEAIRSLLPARGNAVLIAQYKTGKTTLAMNLARALADDEPFLGLFSLRPLEGRVAFFNYEMSEEMFWWWAAEMQIKRPDRIVPLHLRGRHAPIWDERFQDRLVEWLWSWNVHFLIIDPAARAWSGLVDNENDNAKIDVFSAAVDELKLKAGISETLLTHHTGRARQEEGQERGRGATRLEDWMDAGWYWTKDDTDPGRRSLRAIGRDVEVGALDVDYHHDTRRLTATGQTREERREDARVTRVVTELSKADGPLLAGELYAKVGGDKGDAISARDQAKVEGWIAVEGPSNKQSHSLTEAGKKVATYSAGKQADYGS